MPLALVFDKIPQSRVHEELLVVAKSMQLVQDGEAFCLVSIERGGEHDAVRYAAGKDFAGDGIAFDAAGSEGGRDRKEIEEESGD